MHHKFFSGNILRQSVERVVSSFEDILTIVIKSIEKLAKNDGDLFIEIQLVFS